MRRRKYESDIVFENESWIWNKVLSEEMKKEREKVKRTQQEWRYTMHDNNKWIVPRKIWRKFKKVTKRKRSLRKGEEKKGKKGKKGRRKEMERKKGGTIKTYYNKSIWRKLYKRNKNGRSCSNQQVRKLETSRLV